MARLFANAAGLLVGAHLTDEEAAVLSAPAAEATSDFDEATNPALVADLRVSTDSYRLSADGVLTKDGDVVTVNPPAPDTTAADVQAVLGIVTDPAAQEALVRILTRALGQAR